MKIKNQIILEADENKTLTNGSAFGKIIYLADIDNPNNWHEITDEEAKTLQEANLPESDE